MPQHSWSDCPEPVRDEVLSLTAEFQRILSDGLIGIYLHGSLALGCFNPVPRDIDIIGLIDRASTAAQKRSLAEHLLAHSTHPSPIEISLVRTSDIHPWKHPMPYDFH
jgi:hypothetical protein